jgi:2-deoxy-D-gluconate 3-dehydrogenase
MAERGPTEPVAGPFGAFSLSGKVALVTGGSQGIGAAVATTMARAGATVAFTMRPEDGDAPARTLAELESISGRGGAVAIELDLRRTSEIERAVQDVADRFGHIDLLVNNAGTNVQQHALEVDEATWDLILDTNLKGLFFITQAVARRMVEQGRDGEDHPYAITSIASQMGLVGYTRRAAYCSSKAAVVNLTRALAVEWAAHGIRVNAVAPTFVHTPLADAMLADEAFRKDVESRSPMGRIGDPEDVASAVLYLSAPAAGLVTGHTLVVDGGWTAW